MEEDTDKLNIVFDKNIPIEPIKPKVVDPLFQVFALMQPGDSKEFPVRMNGRNVQNSASLYKKVNSKWNYTSRSIYNNERQITGVRIWCIKR